MRLCYIGNPGSIHLRKWLQYLVARGHEVHVITPEPAEVAGVYLHKIPLADFYDVPTSFWYWVRGLGYCLNLHRQWRLVARVGKLISEISPDIVEGHYLTYYGVLASRLDFHPLVITIWGSDVLRDPLKYGKRRKLMVAALRRADMILCFGERPRRALQSLGAPPDKIRDAPLGVDLKVFRPRPRDEGLREELSLNGQPVVVSTRNLEPVYSVATLIKAIPLVLARVPGVNFVIAGDGSQRKYLEMLADSLGVRANLRFAGALPHQRLPDYLSLADVYVSTSLSDGASVSLVEAMACGLACVTTEAGDASKWVINGENGFVVPLENPEQLATRIVYFLENTKAREKAGNISRDLVCQRGDHSREMRRIEGLYRELIKTGKNDRPASSRNV